MNGSGLPIDALRQDVERAFRSGEPFVLTAPTGSGKSTQVPRWAPGRVVVIEPRRVACRSLAQRVAELEGVELGRRVGYQVRDERVASGETRLLFATPGIVLRRFDDLIAASDTFILDEFHERGLETDLLLALLRQRFRGRLAVMSATLDAARLASYLGGAHLRGEGRTFPVSIHHASDGVLLPDVRGLENRVADTVHSLKREVGDILVFLPGKAEIQACAARLRGEPDLEILELHGGLTLAEQSRAFKPSDRRKVLLATNVAETSITVPGIGAVIDSGLVRRTRYHRGRGFLTLSPIARDSADQRAGRAGRTAAGICVRLWSEAAQLEERTPPEIYRESLQALVLAACNCGTQVTALSFLDPPKPHAVEAAAEDLTALGALGEDGELTERGRQLFGLPLDAPLGRLLIEAEASGAPGALDDMIDLVTLLTLGRRLTLPPGDEDEALPTDLAAHCDAVAGLRALRHGGMKSQPLWREARQVRRRLRQLFKRPAGGPDATTPIDRRRLAFLVLAADPRAAHLFRRRGRRGGWSNGGTEIELARDSRANPLEDLEAIVVLETRALGASGKTRVLATRAMPVPIAWLVEAGLGRPRLGEPRLEDGAVVATVETVYARRVLDRRDEVPRGALARQAIVHLFLNGRIFNDSLTTTRERLRLAALALRLAVVDPSRFSDDALKREFPNGVPDIETWVSRRVEGLGVEDGHDLELLSADDFLAPEPSFLIRKEVERRFPLRLELPSGAYDIDYDLERQRALLVPIGKREPPPAFQLPHLDGFSVHMEHKGVMRTLRPRR